MKEASLFKTLSTIYDEFFLLKELTTLTIIRKTFHQMLDRVLNTPEWY